MTTKYARLYIFVTVITLSVVLVGASRAIYLGYCGQKGWGLSLGVTLMAAIIGGFTVFAWSIEEINIHCNNCAAPIRGEVLTTSSLWPIGAGIAFLRAFPVRGRKLTRKLPARCPVCGSHAFNASD